MLLELQRQFRDTVAGAADAAAARVTTPLRLAIYRNNVQKSLIDVLAAAFPVVQRIVGARFFFALARDFAMTHLPDVPHLSVYGAAFPAFIAAHTHTQNLPYLPDVARLEWMRGESYFAADAPVLAPQQLADVPPETLPALKLQLHPAARLVRSAFPIHRIWDVHQSADQEIPAVDMSEAQSVLMTRPKYEVVVRCVSEADAALVDAFINGASLNDAAMAALSIDQAFDLQSALQQHLVTGTFLSAI